ncbi:hypothetical protein GYMLUDRAFT_1010588 [Collybiopsis luxurians FD-317 M1]|uniref:MYND-type domain-containing protein n=1 Tax=Collybiopsis luxurians FD-317 M1 TaxID=944289 RepID=A0A0D0C526_9AGAR|nr:hypothetical protein GYMLUDRAFT_1010588 [Collybiopsis luxurians FD-317 M1]
MGRRLLSDPREPLCKLLDQCQQCWSSKKQGKTLKACSACKIEKYCSVGCQCLAWPAHKQKCHMNQQTQELWSPDMAQISVSLRRFTNNHRPIISQAVIRAFDHLKHPARCLTDVLVIWVTHCQHDPAQCSPRKETTFSATDAAIIPVESVPCDIPHLRNQIAECNLKIRRDGFMCAFFVIFVCVEYCIMHIIPVGFRKEKRDYGGLNSVMGWKDELMYCLNEGIVM